MSHEQVVYLNGEIIPESQAGISIRDRGFLLGDVVFDTTRTFAHKPFKLKEHVERLYDSLAYLRIAPGLSLTEISDLSMQVLEQNLPLVGDNGELWVTQRITRGSHVFGLPGGSEVPTVLIECMPIPFESRAWMFRDGIEVVTPSVRRTPPESIGPWVKSQNYPNLVLADLEVKTNNPNAFAVCLDVNGNLCESDGSNIFVVKDGAVRTPKGQYALCGISRATADRTGARTQHRHPGGRYRPLRRPDRGRDLHHIDEPVCLPGIQAQRYPHPWGAPCPVS